MLLLGMVALQVLLIFSVANSSSRQRALLPKVRALSAPALLSPVSLEQPLPTVYGNDEEWCRRMHGSHSVQPGQSWGTLAEEAVEQWKRLRCDQHFCKPNKMEARGVYICEPLDSLS
jgi:hypothetical protein